MRQTFRLFWVGLGLGLACGWNVRGDSCAPITTFADGKAPLRTRFVAPDGDDATGDGSLARPFRTLSRAATGIQPGDAIRLLPGMHAPGNYLADLTGTEEHPIWIGGVPDQPRPVIAGGNQALHLVRVRHLVVENLEVQGAAQNGINCDDGGAYADPDATRHVVFRHLSFRDIGSGGNQDALKLSGVDDYFVLACSFARTSAGGSGIDHVGCHHGLIARCEFRDMGSNAIQCKGGSEDIEIRWNRFFEGGQRGINIGGSTGFQFFRPPLTSTTPNTEARNIRVLANLFVGADAPVAFVGSVDSVVANNTFITPHRWVLRILQETTSSGGFEFLPCSNNRFVNNLVWFERAELSTFANVGRDTSPATHVFAHNLWYAFDQPSQSRPNLPAPETNGIYGSNPRFVNAPAGDYQLAPDSPAAGAGAPEAAPPADLLERCYASPPSIGAFEARPVPPPDTDQDGMPDFWEDRHGLDRNDPTDRTRDADGDGAGNFHEYVAGTDPRDARSVFRLGVVRTTEAELAISFPSVPDRSYRIERSRSLAAETWEEAASLSGTGHPQFWPLSVAGGARGFFRAQMH